MENRQWQVLYVEDQPEMIELVRLALRSLHCNVIGVSEGDEGLRLMRELRPDVVLLDLMLPGSDGWLISSAMKADPLLADLPVILVTAHVPHVAASFGRPLPHADGYIMKPFKLAQMRATVQGLLDKSVADRPVGQDPLVQ